MDGVVCALGDFPRFDDEYVAQLRKVAIDLGIVPFGIDAPGLLDPAADPDAIERAIAVARGFGAALMRTTPPPPGEVPPATFAETVRVGKALSRAAKAANVTVIVGTAPGTIAEDLGALRHLLKDADSAWLRACPNATLEPAQAGPKSGFRPCLPRRKTIRRPSRPRAHRTWLILDAARVQSRGTLPAAPWRRCGAPRRICSCGAMVGLRRRDRNGRLGPGRRPAYGRWVRPGRPVASL